MNSRKTVEQTVTLLVTSLALLCTAVKPADGQSEVTKVLASDGAALDFFGTAVGIDGDTVIVGARANDDDGDNSGSAYIYDRNQGGTDNWGEVQILTALDAAAGDGFGITVAISDDFAIIGASGNDDNGTGSGSAYIFPRNQGGPNNWGQLMKLIASDAAEEDNFGVRVAISGDTAIVGAGDTDDACPADPLCNSGSAYIFQRDHGGTNNWGEVQILTASDAAEDDLFGTVAISGDIAIVGANAKDDNGTNSGAAYIFYRNQGGQDIWGEVAKLTASDAAGGDQFGFMVAISGNTAIVGAHNNDDNGSNSGSAYIFGRNQGGADLWGEVVKITACDAEEGDRFGISVSISGAIATVGADSDDDACPTDPGCDSGSVYVFQRDHGGTDDWGRVAKLTASDGLEDDLFGVRVSLSDDLAIFGARGDDTGGIALGSSYIFDGFLSPCPNDIIRDGAIDVLDLIALLVCFGLPADPPCLSADVNADCVVNVLDLIDVLLDFGSVCPGSSAPEPQSLEEALEEAGLDEDDWDDFMDIMQTGTQEEKDNWHCWMLHYLECHDPPFGTCNPPPPNCPDRDPFDGHRH